MAIVFAIPDMSDPVIDRSTGLMSDIWYRYFEEFERQTNVNTGGITTNADAAAATTAHFEHVDGKIDSFDLRFEDFDNVDLIATNGVTGGGLLKDAPLTFGLTPILSGRVLGNKSGSLAVPAAVIWDFIDLGDVPTSYVGQGLKSVRVNFAENALEFYTPTAVPTRQWVPLVNGAEPAGFISDGAGNLIMVSMPI